MGVVVVVVVVVVGGGGIGWWRWWLWTVGIWGTWPYGDVATRVYGHMGISDALYRRPKQVFLYRRLDRESLYSGPNSGHMGTWAYRHMAMWK